MRKAYLILFTFFSLATVSVAQVSIVPKAGITLANIALEDKFEGQQSKLGVVGGLGLNFGLSSDNFLSLQPELLYVQKGYMVKRSGIVDADYDYKLNYLELPVLVKIGIGTETVRGYFSLGPSVGYLLNGRVKGSGDLLDVVGSDFDQKIDFVNNETSNRAELNANRIEVGANFGVGLGFALGAAEFIVDGRYNAGLTNVSQDYKSKNQAFYLTGGFRIPISQ